MADIVTWQRIIDAEPRMAALCTAARAAALLRHGIYVDDVYAEAKPFVVALVGWSRGAAPFRTPRRRELADVSACMSSAMESPAPAVDYEFLHDSAAYHVALEHLYSAISDAVALWEEAA